MRLSLSSKDRWRLLLIHVAIVTVFLTGCVIGWYYRGTAVAQQLDGYSASYFQANDRAKKSEDQLKTCLLNWRGCERYVDRIEDGGY